MNHHSNKCLGVDEEEVENKGGEAEKQKSKWQTSFSFRERRQEVKAESRVSRREAESRRAAFRAAEESLTE